jgi:hypothetical protein
MSLRRSTRSKQALPRQVLLPILESAACQVPKDRRGAVISAFAQLLLEAARAGEKPEVRHEAS